ncbi:MAG: hypothetical protein EOO63_07930 [Hymenobacter sp.]|nr:MAG: hypothetical protein EOO63_07930 [Hymenobacter sp.]
MVNYLPAYQQLLRRGITVFEELLRLYAPDKKVENDWAAITIMQTQNQRNSLAERLIDPPTRLTAEETSSVTVSIGHYLDSHWADYQETPTANPQKHVQVVQLHTELENILAEIAPIHNALR